MMVLSLENLYDQSFMRSYELSAGDVLRFKQMEYGDVSCVVWDAALVLSAYLEKLYSSSLPSMVRSKKHVIELGSGTGCCGLVAAALGYATIITDLPSVVPLMVDNIALNQSVVDKNNGSVEAVALSWGSSNDIRPLSNSTFDLILVADCLYYTESVTALVETIELLCKPSTTVLVCVETRDSGACPQAETLFFQICAAKFGISEVSFEEQNEKYRSHDIKLFEMSMKVDKT